MKKTTPEPHHIGLNIRKIRELRNYTQQYMANQLEISKSRYSQIEQQQDIHTAHLFKIAKALDMDIFSILSFDENKLFSAQSPGNFNTTLEGDSAGFNSVVTLLKKMLTSP